MDWVRMRDVRDYFWIAILVFFLYEFLRLLKGSLILWDESVYISMGKYIFSFGAVGAWEIIRPLGLPILLGSIWISKLDAVFFSRILGIIFSFMLLLMVYFLGKRIFNRDVGIIAMVLVMITKSFYDFGAYALTDIPSTLMILISLYFLAGEKYVYAGIFSGTGLLFKFPQGLLIIAVGLWFLAYKRNVLKMAKYYLAFGFTVLPFLIFNYIFYYNDVSKWWHGMFRPFILGSMHQNKMEYMVSGLFDNLSYYIMGLFSENILLIFVIIGLLYFLRRSVYKDEKYNIILFSMFIYLAYFTYIINKQMRFSVMFLPFMALIAGYGIYRTLEGVKWKGYIYGISIAVIFLIFLWNINFGMDFKYLNLKSDIDEFYRYFESNPVNGTILTNEYEVSAYGNNKYVYLYLEDRNGIEEFNRLEKNASAIVFSPRSFCRECDREEFLGVIRKEFKEVFHNSYWGEEYYIFAR